MGVTAAILAGCTSTPAEYGATLFSQDPKWTSPQCVEARRAATDYKEKKLNWGAGMLIGPYGLALVAAGEGVALVPSLATEGLPLDGVDALDIPGLGMRRVVLRHLTRSRGASPLLDTVTELVREAAASFSYESSGT